METPDTHDEPLGSGELRQMIGLMARIVPREYLLEKLEEDIKSYRLAPSDQLFKQIELDCMIFLMKTCGDEVGYTKVFEDFNDLEQGKKLMERMKGS